MGINTAAMQLPHSNGRELMAGVGAGDGEAVRRLVDTYRGKVFSFLYGSVGNREDALDLTQEVMFRVCQKADQYDGRYPLSPWIYRVAANLRIDYTRRRNARLHSNTVELDETVQSNRCTRETPEDQAMRRDLQKRFRQALDRLPPRQRRIVEMRLLEENRLREIADSQGISVGTVKSTLHAGIRRLREALSDLATA